MVEAGPKPITSARLSRRTALKRAAGAVAAAIPIAASTPAHPDAHLLELERALRAASADWQRASDRLASAEQRLFAMHPVVPPGITVLESKDSEERTVPDSWPVLRRHLRRVHRDKLDLKARIAAARVQWIDYHAARDRLAKADWYIASQAAEEQAGAAVEALHERVARIGLRIKLQILWDPTGHRPENPDQDEWDVSDQILWSALRDAKRAK